MASTLADRLRERLRRGGAVPFADWMQACLYDPEGGFYARHAGEADSGHGVHGVHGIHPAGTRPGTHFATGPTLHPFFAQAVAADLAEAWRRAGSPTAWTVAEFGAGTGALARDTAAALRRAGVPIEWVAIDVHPGSALPGVHWSTTAPVAFDAAVANEFLDALPFDLHEWRDGRWNRVGVGLDDEGEEGGEGREGGERFAWRLLGESRIHLPPGREDGERRVVMPGMPLWLDAVARAGARFVVVVDYGATGPARDARAFRDHGPAEPLDEPGTVDLTADVDFALLQAHAARAGFKPELETQEAFLLRHGVLDALNAADRSSVYGASSYLRLRQLLLPTGMGAAFKVLRLQRPSAT
ncbi:MAG TPA: SAM-dependent methyltransferase [Candidatus Thermoplasmatota archaeon]|nr:SAM-dependent methyltransferase [Candidatus Thermoplasmatota archaeon]